MEATTQYLISYKEITEEGVINVEDMKLTREEILVDLREMGQKAPNETFSSILKDEIILPNTDNEWPPKSLLQNPKSDQKLSKEQIDETIHSYVKTFSKEEDWFSNKQKDLGFIVEEGKKLKEQLNATKELLETDPNIFSKVEEMKRQVAQKQAQLQQPKESLA